jgi:hypothetical protein
MIVKYSFIEFQSYFDARMISFKKNIEVALVILELFNLFWILFEDLLLITHACCFSIAGYSHLKIENFLHLLHGSYLLIWR